MDKSTPEMVGNLVKLKDIVVILQRRPHIIQRHVTSEQPDMATSVKTTQMHNEASSPAMRSKTDF